MSYSVAVPAVRRNAEPALDLFLLPLKLFHALINSPTLIFLLTMTAMLFRPPDLKSFPIDRVAFFALVILVPLRLCLLRERLRVFPATWPLLALLALGFWGAVTQPCSAQAWSLFAAKWMVPFVMFHTAGFVFRDGRSLRTLELFLLAVLFYLCAISVFSLLNANAFIFPKFITDENLGIHADRARGPFLQAVANGVCLNLLGLIALDSFRRGKLRGVPAGILFVAAPLALLATRTRAVWLSAAISVGYLLFLGSVPRLRRVALALTLAVIAGGSIVYLYRSNNDSLAERLLDRSPVDFRTEMYRAGLEMFAEKPLFGWGNEWAVQPEIEKRVSNFHPEYYVFHNTFLELAVQRGILGLGLYLWLTVSLFRLRSSDASVGDLPFSGRDFRKLWPMMLGVYLLNASAVVMNYQFVNALLFTIAGILASQAERRTLTSPSLAWSSAQ